MYSLERKPPTACRLAAQSATGQGANIGEKLFNDRCITRELCGVWQVHLFEYTDLIIELLDINCRIKIYLATCPRSLDTWFDTETQKESFW